MQIQHIATRSLARARHLRARPLDFESRPEASPDTLADLFAAALVLLVFLAAAILV